MIVHFVDFVELVFMIKRGKEDLTKLQSNQCVVCKKDKGKNPSFCSTECASEYYFPSGWDDCKMVSWKL